MDYFLGHIDNDLVTRINLIPNMAIFSSMGRGPNRKIWGYFSPVDGACIDSDKNIFFTSMNFDVGATISLLVKS